MLLGVEARVFGQVPMYSGRVVTERARARAQGGDDMYKYSTYSMENLKLRTYILVVPKT